MKLWYKLDKHGQHNFNVKCKHGRVGIHVNKFLHGIIPCLRIMLCFLIKKRAPRNVF